MAQFSSRAARLVLRTSMRCKRSPEVPWSDGTASQQATLPDLAGISQAQVVPAFLWVAPLCHWPEIWGLVRGDGDHPRGGAPGMAQIGRLRSLARVSRVRHNSGISVAAGPAGRGLTGGGVPPATATLPARCVPARWRRAGRG